MPMSEGKEEGWGFEDGGREGLSGRSRRRRRGGRRPRAGRRRAPPPAGSNALRPAAVKHTKTQAPNQSEPHGVTRGHATAGGGTHTLSKYASGSRYRMGFALASMRSPRRAGLRWLMYLEGLRPSRPRRRRCARSNSSSTLPGPPLNKTEIKSMYLHVESFEVRFISRRSASGSPLRPMKLIH